MRSRKIVVLALIGAVLGLNSCRKDPVNEPTVPGANGLTPVTLDIPAWAMDSIDMTLIPQGNELTQEGIALGRRLFYEKALSDDFSMSCGSCHLQEHAFTDPLRFSVGTDGSIGTRNAMTIQNAVAEHFFFWDGRAGSLEAQAFGPVVNPVEMRNTWPVVVERLQQHPDYPTLFERVFGTSTIDSVMVVQAIAQFERTMLSFDSPFDRYEYAGDLNALTEAQVRGRELFMGEAQCSNCHAPPLFLNHALNNIGLELLSGDDGLAGITGNSEDRGRFKTTTLRNIAVSGPYMHDGRFETLTEVVDFYADSVNLSDPNLDEHMFAWLAGEIDLDPQERADLVSFMEALTDEGFLTDPTLSDPN